MALFWFDTPLFDAHVSDRVGDHVSVVTCAVLFQRFEFFCVSVDIVLSSRNLI